MRGNSSGWLFLVFVLWLASARATVLVPSFTTWGINGSGPYRPGDSISVGVSVSATRDNPSQNNTQLVTVYFSSRSNNTSVPAIAFPSQLSASIPANNVGGGPVVNGTYQIPTVFNGNPLIAGNYFIVFTAVGSQGSAIESTQVTVVVPDISVEQPVGTALSDGASTVSFGEAALHGAATRSFLLRNPGSGTLTGISTSINGTNSADFSVTTAPATSVVANDSTGFVVQFSPAAAGARTASLHLASSVAGSKNPFDIALSGTGDLAPTATTSAATNTTATTTTLQGTANANSTSTTTSFDYGLTTNYGTNIAGTPGTLTGSTATAVTANVSGLTPGTTYHFRVNAVSTGGIAHGSDATFTTPPSPPTATTSAATNATDTTATLQATVNAHSASTTTSFDYGLTSSYGTSVAGTPATLTGSATTAVTADLSGLTPGTTYHFRVNAVSAGGTAHGSDATFTTLPSPPTATTAAALDTTATTTTLQGTVNASNASTTTSFDYGLTSSYGSSVAGIPATVNGSISTAVAANLSGLASDTTYHFRVNAVSAGGTVHGSDATFTTLQNTDAPALPAWGYLLLAALLAAIGYYYLAARQTAAARSDR